MPNWSVEVACLEPYLEAGEAPRYQPVTSGWLSA